MLYDGAEGGASQFWTTVTSIIFSIILDLFDGQKYANLGILSCSRGHFIQAIFYLNRAVQLNDYDEHAYVARSK